MSDQFFMLAETNANYYFCWNGTYYKVLKTSSSLERRHIVASNVLQQINCQKYIFPSLSFCNIALISSHSRIQQYSSHCARLPLNRERWKNDVAHQQGGMRWKFYRPTFSLQQWTFLKWLPECLCVIILPVFPGWELVAEAAQRYRKNNRINNHFGPHMCI